MVFSQNSLDNNVLFRSGIDDCQEPVLSLIGIDGHLKLLIISIGEDEA